MDKPDEKRKDFHLWQKSLSSPPIDAVTRELQKKILPEKTKFKTLEHRVPVVMNSESPISRC